MEQPQSLRSLFAAAKAEKTALEPRPDSNSDSYRNDVNATIAKFEECQRLVALASLFSSNEALEDVSTGDLPYLTVDYLFADILQRSYTSDREATLRRALELYESYLARLDDYQLLKPNDKKLYDRYISNPTSFSLAPTNDAASRREVKVARFQEEKELKEKLEYLSNNQGRLQSDEDDVRQLYLAEINLFTHEAFQSMDLVSQELSMLSAIRRNPPNPEQLPHSDPRRRNDDPHSGYSERLDAPLSQLLQGGRLRPLLSKEGKPLQPFTLLDRRTQLQQGVFRSGHNLPTMTIDEYLEEERKRGGIIEGGEKSGMKEEVDEDDMDKADEETMKARAWDEFTEANPRGSGNTLNRG
ncbi:IGBP1/TAP42 family protein [Aspergillus clavatus NRRL 1]|uniref:TOR signalling pathway regulator (TapA), putative n=1 Tax=Aspergillus clavatus (strain ATCC 1007 / CBS 513.65 / DSM 816 / NCTC 3887 / NRRL 1 / QM 1276 / 107) TaxID=344612 RepID=A1CBC8_ASPCL|nr:TOR signaling pathway regulator (TapA), putative [Aspergillus clavatus NRRL 1]EAW13046.1 TOR signalling pathway regulator (TapA), putative [Aspergillus clavatus NRRL 1]